MAAVQLVVQRDLTVLVMVAFCLDKDALEEVVMALQVAQEEEVAMAQTVRMLI